MHTVDDEYLVGDRLLVAPLFAGEPGRDVVLPPGEWHDLWTGALVPAGRTLHVNASTNRIPAFAKAGSIIVQAAVSNSTNVSTSRDLTVRIFGDGHLPFRIASTDGEELEISWDAATQKGQVRQGANLPRPYRITSWERADA